MSKILIKDIIFYNDIKPKKEKLQKLIDKNVKFYVNKEAKLFQILNKDSVLERILKTKILFTDFLSGKTYEVFPSSHGEKAKIKLIKSSSCSIDTSCQSTTHQNCSIDTSCQSTTNQNSSTETNNCEEDPLFTVSTFLGAPSLANRKSGPIYVEENEDLNLWSTGGITITATKGSVDLEFEVTNQSIQDRAPISGVDFAGWTSDAIFYDSSSGILYLYSGKTGLFTAINSVSLIGVFVNQTYYVDAQYGNDATAASENMRLPWQTIEEANTAAIIAGAPAVIYVQPGSYRVNSFLFITQNINWFFSEGAEVAADSSYIFLAVSPDVNCTISGYGKFLLENNSLIAATNNSIINFTCDFIIGVGGQTTVLVLANNSSSSQYFNMSANSIKTDYQTISQPSSVIQVIRVTGDINATLNVKNDIISRNIVYSEQDNINSTGLINIDINCPNINGGNSNIVFGDLYGELFYNDSSFININVISQNINNFSKTYAIATEGNNNNIKITAENFNTNGPVLYSVHGSLQSRATNPKTELNILNLNVDIDLNVGLNIFDLDGSTLTGKISFLTVEVTNLFNVLCVAQNNSFVKFDFDIIDARGLDGFFINGLASIQQETTTLDIRGNTINNTGIFLNTIDYCAVNIQAVAIECTSPRLDISPINITGTVPIPVTGTKYTINIITDSLILNVNSSNTTNIDAISHNAGSLYLKTNTYSFNGTYVNGIYIGANTFNNSINILTASNLLSNANFLVADGIVLLNIGTINLASENLNSAISGSSSAAISGLIDLVQIDNRTACLELNNNSVFTGTINRIVYANGTLTNGTVFKINANSSFSINNDSIETADNILLNYSSTEESFLNFNKIISTIQLSNYITGTSGILHMNGKSIQVGSGETIFFISGTMQLFVDLDNLSYSENEYIFFFFTTTTNEHILNIKRIIGPDSTPSLTTGFLATTSSSNVILTSDKFTTGNADITSTIFFTNNDSVLTVNILDVNIAQCGYLSQNISNSNFRFTYNNMVLVYYENVMFMTISSVCYINGGNALIASLNNNDAFIITNSSKLNGTFGKVDFRGSTTALLLDTRDAATFDLFFQRLETVTTVLIHRALGNSFLRVGSYLATSIFATPTIILNVTQTVTDDSLTIGGYFKNSPGTAIVEYTAGSNLLILRVLSSILVTSPAGACVTSPFFVTTIFAPSSANTTTGGLAAIFPAGALLVSSAVS